MDPTSATGGAPGPGIEVVVGRIGKPHGIRGEVTVDVRTDEPERRFAPGAVLLARPPAGSHSPHATLTVESSRWHQTTLLVAFDEVPDRDCCRGRAGHRAGHGRGPCGVSRRSRRVLRPPARRAGGVRRATGVRLGEVTAVVHGGAQDLLTIRTPDARDALVPFVRALVPEVDLARGRVVVADRPGLVTPLPGDEG